MLDMSLHALVVCTLGACMHACMHTCECLCESTETFVLFWFGLFSSLPLHKNLTKSTSLACQ